MGQRSPVFMRSPMQEKYAAKASPFITYWILIIYKRKNICKLEFPGKRIIQKNNINREKHLPKIRGGGIINAIRIKIGKVM